MKVTTNLLLLLRLRMSGAIYLLHSHASSTCTVITLPFITNGFPCYIVNQYLISIKQAIHTILMEKECGLMELCSIAKATLVSILHF